MPLAIRLAGAVLAARPGLPLGRLARDCSSDRVLDVLAAEDSSVREAISCSCRALRPAARTAFSLAAAYVADEIPAESLTKLADGDDRVAGELVSVGLLIPAETETSGPGFRMHPLVRAYGREGARDHSEGSDKSGWRAAGSA
jgi:hypothetical protein